MDNYYLQTLGEIINIKRKSLGMSQLELSINAGHKSAAYISWIEQGKRNVTIKDLFTILAILDIQLLYKHRQDNNITFIN